MKIFFDLSTISHPGRIIRPPLCFLLFLLFSLLSLVLSPVFAHSSSSPSAAPHLDLAQELPLPPPNAKEAYLLYQVETLGSPWARLELARLRTEYAAEAYRRWQQAGDAADFNSAVFYAAFAAELSPLWDRPLTILGMIYAEFIDDADALALASEALGEAVRLNPANGAAQLLLAQVFMNQGEFARAIEKYTELILASESMANASNLAPLALCFILDQRLDEGVDFFTTLAGRYPEQSNIPLIAAVLRRQSGDESLAKKQLAELIASERSSPATRSFAARLLAEWRKEDAP